MLSLAQNTTGGPVGVRPWCYSCHPGRELVRVAALLLPGALTRQGLFGPAFVARLQVERVLLNVFDDVFLLHFPLETAERAFNRLTFLNFYFCQG